MIFAVLRQSPTATQGQSSAAESPSDRALSGRQPTATTRVSKPERVSSRPFSLRTVTALPAPMERISLPDRSLMPREAHAAQQEHAGAPFHILGELRQHLDHGDGAALRCEVFGGFAADEPSAEHEDVLARFGSAQNVLRGDGSGGGGAETGDDGQTARGHDHGVGGQVADAFRRGLAREAERHARALGLAIQVIRNEAQIFLVRGDGGKADLPAVPIRAFEQDDLMPRSAAVAAAHEPAGPAPTTTTRPGVSAFGTAAWRLPGPRAG